MMIDFTASLVTGGGALRARVESAAANYGEGCRGYFEDILSKRGNAFCDSACGFLLLDSLLQKNRIDRAALNITLDERGRPRTNRGDLDFSISHSEGCAVCVVEIGEGANIGVDVQRERPYSSAKMDELAKAFMSERELAEFRCSEHKPEVFFAAWTRREAYVKRIGSDIFDNLKCADLSGESFREGVISACGRRYYYSVNARRGDLFPEEEEKDECAEVDE
ncbi:MAG: 4'-phosphopantetheinyl transferase superfamily protein [Lachnospiraceae bacterium]|nr:4'-phosphopantetheinyl transferase superfamily protein [Ruminococcus sp.]MCM1275246.1 4'-phosphopantetheinyl transferase superfamily protein [Lachnospiraceae bacterium]